MLNNTVVTTLRNKIASIMFGAISGISNLGNSLAIAALLFTGPLVSGYGLGVGLILLSGIILAITVSLRSNQFNAVAEVQETTVAILAATVSAATSNIFGSAEIKVATAIAIMGTFTIITGALFLIVGHLRMGGFARFLPYPVIAGFLAGSGWLLLVGGMSMVTGEQHELAIIARLTEPLILAKALTAITFAVLMVVILRRISHPLISPFLLLVAGCSFYLVLFAGGIETEKARSYGWLIEISSDSGIVFPTPSMLLLVDWRQVILSIPMAITAATLSIIGIILNISGLELAIGKELDTNAELCINGQANLLTGAIGGVSGFTALGHTLLAEQMGIRGRSAGLTNAAVLGLGMLIAQQLITVIPGFLTSGLVMFLGLGLLYEWAIETRHKLPVAEWTIVFIILVVIATIGLLEGLATGLLVSVVMFIHSYSLLPVIRLSANGSELRSSVDRSPSAMRILNQYGATIEVINLQGYLFFGTAERIVEHVRQRINNPNLQALRFLILDFSHVGGCDSAAVVCFVKVRNIAELEGIKMLFSRVPSEVECLLQQAGLGFNRDESLSLISDRDQALEICESVLLTEQHDESSTNDALHYLEAMLGTHPKLPDFIDAMECLNLKADTTLIHSNDPSTEVFILIRGKLKVLISLPNGLKLRLRTMTSGAIVGEIAFYLQKNRTADVVVEEDSIVLRIDTIALNRLERENSEVAILVHRLLAMNLAEKLIQSNRMIELANS